MITEKTIYQQHVTIDETDYTITIIPDETPYGLYYETYWNTERRALEYMYGLSSNKIILQDAFDIAIANLPDYIDED